MSDPVTVGLLHPGRMGAAIATQIMSNDHPVLWCPEGRSTVTRRRAENAGLHPVPLAQLLANSQVILSICPPAVAEEIAITVAGFSYRGIYVEANAISPVRMHRITTRFTEAGTTVVDGCIFGSPPGGQSSVRFYLAGATTGSRRVADLFIGSLVEPVVLGNHLGQASALKMIFACFQRTSRTAATLAHALADDHGITQALLAEAERMPRDILVNRDFLPSVAARAWRWAPEMHEVADTLSVQHLPPDLALATAAVLQHWADHTDQRTDPGSTLQQLHTSHRSLP
jgi:3-hydroxyisobutyrate dehydrogenase-like beta-hydroxyacid dehydrogenase